MTAPAPRWPEALPPRRDLVIGTVLTLASILLVTWLSRDSWFYGDFWDFLLGRSLTDPITLLEPHNGHLQLPVALVQQTLYRTVGFDYWPWYWLPRVIGYGALCFSMWLVLRRRGADPVVSWLALITLLVLGSSAVTNATTIGPFIVIPMVALAAAIYVGGGPRPGRELMLFSALIVGMVITTSSGLAGAAALGIVGLSLGRLRQIWPAFTAGLVVYFAWLVAARGSGAGAASFGFDALAEVPAALPAMLGAALSRATALPLEYGPALALGLAAALVVWSQRGEIGSFEGVWLVMTALYMMMVIVARVAPGRLDPDAVRFSFVSILLMVPAIVPLVRLPHERWAHRIVVASLVVVVLLGNLIAFRNESNRWEAVSRGVQSHLDAVATLLLAGEPALSDSELVLPEGGGARRGLVTVSSVSEFLSTGWDPGPPDDAPAIESGRGVLRMAVSIGGAGEACQRVAAGNSVTVSTNDYAAVVVRASSLARTSILWRDDFGRGVRTVAFQGRRTVDYPAGATGEMTFAVESGGPLHVCSPAD